MLEGDFRCVEPCRFRTKKNGFHELVVNGFLEYGRQKSISKYVCFDHGGDVAVVVQRIMLIVAVVPYDIDPLAPALRECLCLEPVDEDIEEAALDVVKFDRPLGSFLPWSVECLLEVLGVMSEQRLVDVVPSFLGADLNRDELTHGDRATTQSAGQEIRFHQPVMAFIRDFQKTLTYAIEGAQAIANPRGCCAVGCRWES
jgi:hypothetical protein